MAINTNHPLNKISASDSDLVLDSEGQGTNISVSSKRVVNVQDPLDPQDAVTKKYVDDTTNGLSFDLTSLTNLIDDRISQIFGTLDKLTPQSPSSLSTKTLNVENTQSYRITDFSQTDNTNTGLSATSGDIVTNVLRSNDFTTNILEQVGPGNNGTLEVIVNGSTTVSKDLVDGDNNGITTDTDSVIITNNVDYGTITGDALGFHFILDLQASGTDTVPEGWNDIKLKHTSTESSSETNVVTWYSDHSDPGAPEVSNINIIPNAMEHTVYSSSVPHYTSQQQFDISFDVNKLSGDFFPLTDDFVISTPPTPGSGLRAINNIDYTTAGLPTPLPRNYLVDEGTATITTSVGVQYGTGISLPNTGPTAKIINSYYETSVNFNVSDKILYMFDDFTYGTPIDETRVIVTDVGFGSGDARRIETVGTDTPGTADFVNFNGETSILSAFDATVVGGKLTHDQTDYSIGYLPTGPDLSNGRSGSQYIVFAFNRMAASKFAIEWSGKISGCWVKLPGSLIDTTSSLNGWMDTTIPYEGIGVPGSNIGLGGNGSNGCGLAGTITIGQVVTETINITFGTESSSNSTDNLILVRIKLEDGDYMSSLKFIKATR